MQTVFELNHGKGNPRNSEGSFVTLKDGRILYAYTRFVGDSGEDFGAALIAGVVSADNGKTWECLPDPILRNEGGQNVMSVSLLRLRSGRLAIFYLRKNSSADCQLMMRKSDDEGQTWSQAILCTRALGYHVVNNDRVIQLENGALIAPATLHRIYTNKDGQLDPEAGYSCFDSRGLNTFFRSDDEGESWRSAGDWWSTPIGMAQECGVIELRDHSLYSWCRTDLGCQWCARSTDEGKTWSVPEATKFLSPISPMSMKRIPSTGDLVAVWNDHDPRWRLCNNANKWQGRTPLAIAISKDDGASWLPSILVEKDPERGFCYIAIHLAGEALLLAYCCGKTPSQLADSKILRIALAEIYE